MNRYFIQAILALCATNAFAWQGKIEVSTPNTMMLLHAGEGEDLRLAYFGAKTANPWQVGDAGADLNFSAMPAFGTVDMINQPALQVRHANECPYHNTRMCLEVLERQQSGALG